MAVVFCESTEEKRRSQSGRGAAVYIPGGRRQDRTALGVSHTRGDCGYGEAAGSHSHFVAR